MVHIVPSISFIKQFRSQIESGLSVSASLKETFSLEEGEFSQKVHIWWMGFQSGKLCAWNFKSHFELAFIEILEQGLQGAPIHKFLIQIESEMLEEFDIQWKSYLESLPTKLSLPLLFLFFPSYVILIFGPLISIFLQGVAQ